MEGSVLQQKPKTVLKSVNKTEQLVGMSKSKREKNQNKNHPNGRPSFGYCLRAGYRSLPTMYYYSFCEEHANFQNNSFVKYTLILQFTIHI